MNHILCPSCFAKTYGSEKSCGHGLAVGVTCVTCGSVRAVDDPPWHCKGSITPATPPPGTARD